MRRGRPFRCKGCATKIVVPKAAVNVGIAAFIALSALSKIVPFSIIALLVAAALLLEWLLARVDLGEEPDFDREESATPLP